jgi:hypothetical protein
MTAVVEVFRRRPSEPAAPPSLGRHPKTFTIADIGLLSGGTASRQRTSPISWAASVSLPTALAYSRLQWRTLDPSTSSSATPAQVTILRPIRTGPKSPTPAALREQTSAPIQGVKGRNLSL